MDYGCRPCPAEAAVGAEVGGMTTARHIPLTQTPNRHLSVKRRRRIQEQGMRRSYILLLVVAILPVLCGAISTRDDQTKPAHTALENDSIFGLLRTHEETENDVDKEERGLGSALKKLLGIKKSDFAKSDLKKALNDKDLRLELYKKWDKYTVGEIKLKLKNTDMHHPRERALFYGYLNKYKKGAKAVERPVRKTKINFKVDERKVRTFDDEGKFVDKVERLDGVAA